MDKLNALRDYALVAFLMARGHPVSRNADGSYRAEISVACFAAEETEYRQHWKPLLSRIRKIKRSLSAQRPQAVNLDSVSAPQGPISQTDAHCVTVNED